MNKFSLKIAAFLALIAALTYISVAVAPEAIEDADAVYAQTP